MRDNLIYAAIFAVALAFSYYLASIGEPQSVWFWCSMLRWC